ncbi:MAG: hypothetical protein ACHQNT_06485 [Bacteroidia bacterium]
MKPISGKVIAVAENLHNSATLFLSRYHNVPLLIITIFCFLFWKGNNYFFYNDEWIYLYRLQDFDIRYVFTPHGSHFIPLSKLFFFLQMRLFGLHFNWYHYLTLVEWSVACFLFYRFISGEIFSLPVSLLLSIFIAVHPSVFTNVLLNFESFGNVQILFLLATLLSLSKYFKSKNILFLFLSMVFLIIQNYVWANGVFYPLVCILMVYFYLPNADTNKKIVLTLFGLLMFIFIASPFLSVHFIKDPRNYSPELSLVERLSNNFGLFLAYFFKITSLHLSRLIFLAKQEFLFKCIANILFYGLMAAAIYFSNRTQRKKIIVAFTLYFASIVTIALGRFDKYIAWHYFGFTCIPLTCLIALCIYMVYVQRLKHVRLIPIVLVLYMVLSIAISYSPDRKKVNKIRNEYSLNYLDFQECIEGKKTEYTPPFDPLFYGSNIDKIYFKSYVLTDTAGFTNFTLAKEAIYDCKNKAIF